MSTMLPFIFGTKRLLAKNEEIIHVSNVTEKNAVDTFVTAFGHFLATIKLTQKNLVL